MLAYAVAPNAVGDDLTSSPVNQNQSKSITEALLISNDVGDGKNIKSVASSSTKSATITWNNTTKIVTYDPTTVTAFIALPDGDSTNDTFTYTLQGTDGADDTAIVTVKIIGVNDAPTITGVASSILNVNDNDSSQTPFTGAVISDPDTGETVTVTVTINAAAEGTFTNLDGFTSNGSGSYTYTGSPADSTSKLAGLKFVPTPNRIAVGISDNTLLSVSVSDGTAAPVTDSRTVSVTSVNDAPALLPLTVGPFNASAGATVNLFPSITVTDADFDDQTGSGDVGAPVGDRFTATITLSPSPYGVILSSGFTGSGATYSFTGGRGEVQAAIRAVQYLAPSAEAVFQVSLKVTDSNGGISNAIAASISVTQPTPGMSGLVAGQQLADNGVIFPFASAAFNNFGGTDRLIEITLDDDIKGAFDILGAFTKTGSVYSMAGNSVSATNAIQGLRFKPTPNRITGANEAVTFSVVVKSGVGPSSLSTDTLSLTVAPFNDAPTIISDGPEIRINDDEVATPFATMTLADPDAGGAQSLTVTVSLMGEYPDTNAPRAGGGVLASAVGAPVVSGVTFTPTGVYPDTTYTISGSPAAVTDFIRLLVFTPDSNRNPVGQRETVKFTIAVTDGKGGTAQNQGTTVIVTSVNGAPRIDGIPSLSQQPYPVPASGNSMAKPFIYLTVSDEENLTFTITLDEATKGTLSTVDFTSTVAGIYKMTGTPAEITTALQALVYTLNPSYPFPPDQLGLTTFTLAAADSTNTTTQPFTLFIRERNVTHIVTSSSDSGAGSLREAVSLAGNDDTIVFDFPVDSFPVTLSLESTLEIDKNLTITGSGVDQLTISGGDGVGLFFVTNGARFTVEQLTLKDGFAASYGGAIEVDSGCGLTAHYCSFVGNHAGQYGGAIDVNDGDLTVDHCLFYLNGVDGSTAKAGGAISVYASVPASITNSTFVDNEQTNAGGLGGGALYAENADLAQFFNLRLEHCTFSNNIDAAHSGSAVLSSSAGLKVQVRNNIFADAQGLVLDVLGGGRFDSLGGNIATDATTTTYTQGEPQNVTLLNHASDKRSTDPRLGPLADHNGATWTCALLAGSPAIDSAIAVTPLTDALGTDQRGFWRGASVPDRGAFEAGAFKRVNINEIFVAGSAGTDFIEFYNPRESATLDMSGLQLWIDGILVRTFTAQVLAPGVGFAWMSSVDLNEEKGSIELKNAGGQRILLVDYVSTFVEGGVDLDTTGQSINRYPRYEGGFLPHQRAVENITGLAGGDLTSPGDDVDGSPLNGGNAPPIAVADVDENLMPVYSILANESFNPDVLLNDIEFDRTDTLKITEIMPLSSGNITNSELAAIDGTGVIALANLPPGLDTTVTPIGADVTINPDQLGLTYDPISSSTMIALSEGESVTDIWAYTILDDDEFGVPQSRGINDTKKIQNITKATNYFAVTVTGVNEAPEPADDSFATAENQAVRLLADATLLAPVVFDFGDQDADYGDFDETGAPVVLKPAPPTISLLANDDDVDNDDTNASLLLVAVHPTAVPADLLETTSELGARVVLDIRAERGETSIVYDPRSSTILNALSAGEIATDSFYYSVFDRHGARGVAKVTVTVTGVNDVPMAVNDSGFVANEDAPLSISGALLLSNDTDPDQNGGGADDVPTIVQPFATNSSLGANLSFDGTNIVYDPTTVPNYNALARNETITDTFAYSITDSMGGVSHATVTLLVEGRNDAPVAADDLLEILENQVTAVNAVTGLLANDVDVDINGTPPDDDPWVLPQRGFITPMGAKLDIAPDGSYRYDANSAAIDSLKEGELAIETFPYTVIDNSRTRASDDTFRVLANRTDVVLPVLANDVVAGTSTTEVISYGQDIADPNKLIIESPNHGLRDGLLVKIEGYQGTGDYNGVHAITSMDRDHFSVNVPYLDDPAGTRGTWRAWFNITAVSASDHGGVVTISGGQNLLYTATSGFYGEESFSYTIEDGAGGQDVGKATIQVILAPLNGFVSASADRFHLGMGEAGVVVDVLANDNLLPSVGSALTITGTAPVSGATGTLEIVNNGKNLRYTPADLSIPIEETFTYDVSGGGDSAQTTVTFDVRDRSDLLSGSDDAFFVVLGSTNNLLDVLGNDPSLPTFPVVSSLVKVNGSSIGGPTSSGGSVSLAGNKVSYTPPASILTDTFTYTSRDASGATTTQSVKVRVVPAAVDFFASDDHYTVVAGSGPLELPILLNDGTVQNAGASLSVVNLGLDTNAPPAIDRVSITGGNTIRYTPPAIAGMENFTYEIAVGTIERREARITITVVDSFESAPDPENDFYHVAKDSGPHVLDVLKNDLPYPAAGWSWKISAKAAPDHGGTLTILSGGSSLSYAPAPGFFGTETFSYTIADAFGATATATVSIRVGEMITAPDTFAVLEDSVDNPLAVLINDDLLDRYSSDYTIFAVGSLSQGGTTTIDGGGSNNRLLYTPATGVTGQETFTYTVVDRSGTTHDEAVTVQIVGKASDRDEAELQVRITGVNDLPMLSGMADGAITDKQSIYPFAGVAITDLDEAGNQLQTVTVSYDSSAGTVVAPGMTTIATGTYQIVATPAAVSTALRNFHFTPFENLIDYIDPGHADVNFTWSVTDGYIATPIMTVTIVTVTPVDDAPTISNVIPDQVFHVNEFTRGLYLLPSFADVDDNVPGGQLVWTVTGNTNPSIFDSVTVNPVSQILVLDFAVDQVGFSDITVRGTDRGHLFVETTFRVTVEGPPQILLAAGQSQPPTATYIQGSYDRDHRDYIQAFRVVNNGTLPVDAFVVQVSGLNQRAIGITLPIAKYSTDENGTPNNFLDDTTSSGGVTILQKSTYSYDVKYGIPIPPLGSVVVHLTYRAFSSEVISIRPNITIRLSTPNSFGKPGVGFIERSPTGEVNLKLNVAAGHAYQLQYGDDLVTWKPWLTPVPVSDFSGAIKMVDDGFNTGLHPVNVPKRFYRLIEPATP